MSSHFSSCKQTQLSQLCQSQVWPLFFILKGQEQMGDYPQNIVRSLMGFKNEANICFLSCAQEGGTGQITAY
jgi:hypothetical protein